MLIKWKKGCFIAALFLCPKPLQEDFTERPYIKGENNLKKGQSVRRMRGFARNHWELA